MPKSPSRLIFEGVSAPMKLVRNCSPSSVVVPENNLGSLRTVWEHRGPGTHREGHRSLKILFLDNFRACYSIENSYTYVLILIPVFLSVRHRNLRASPNHPTPLR